MTEEPLPKYIKQVACENCGKQLTYKIPRGTSIESFLENELCKFCDCYVLQFEKKSKW